jgi:hypothetical protein
VKNRVQVQNTIGRATGGAGTVNLSKAYAYDAVYGQYSKQKDIFTECVLPTIEEVMQGYSATVFAVRASRRVGDGRVACWWGG